MAVNHTLDSGTDLIKHWGQLSNAAMVGAVVLGIAILIAVVIYIIFNYKKSKMIQDAKDERYRSYAESNRQTNDKLDKLSNSIVRSQSEISRNINESLEGVKNILINVESTMKVSKNQNDDFKSILLTSIEKIDVVTLILNNLLAKTKGAMSVKDSHYLIKVYFYKIMFYDIEKIIHKSLEENDFVNRKSYVTDKVRTNIGGILSENRSNLSEYGLSVSIHPYFKIDSTSVSERFMLVDLIWMSVEDIFISKIGIKEKKEEASLRIVNVIRDYLTEILATEDPGEETTGYGKVISNHD